MNLWTGKFGDEYTKRNTEATLLARRSLLEAIIPMGCQSILEVGANTGLNLAAISQFSQAELFATEPNDKARAGLLDVVDPNNIRSDHADKLGWPDGHVDLVLTSGLLIHIPTDKLEQSIRELHRVAGKWIICGEYFAPKEEMIPYRGYDNQLWRRDYGSLFMDLCPDLHPVMNPVFAWKKTTGLDNLTFWVFEKGAMRH